MKRIIVTSLCAIFTLGLFAQKGVTIHMKDGTKKEIPMVAIKGFNFGGKAIVNDNDYTQLTATLHSGENLDIALSVTYHTDDPFITAIEAPLYGEDWGILYATSPNVTIENGTLIAFKKPTQYPLQTLSNAEISEMLFGESARNGATGSCHADLEFETTYYFRSFVRRPANNNYSEEYLYSTEQVVYTDKPTMKYYGVDADPSLYAATGYVIPSEAAFTAFMEQSPQFNGTEATFPFLLDIWEKYLTPEIIEQLKPLCTTVHNCSDGRIYVLDAIGNEWAEFLMNYCNEEMVMSGYVDEGLYNRCTQKHITCGKEWQIPNNEYWEYRNNTATANPEINFNLNKPLMSNYKYRLEVTLAPDTTIPDTTGITIQPNILTILLAGTGFSRIYVVKNQSVEIKECTTLTFDEIIPDGFGEATITINSNVGARDRVSSRILRIAQVKVVPVEPVEGE